MKIGIIGGGSIGLLFAYYLHIDHSVCLYVRSKEQAEELQKNGLFLERDGVKKHINLDVKFVSEWCGEEDATFIAVKQYHLPDLIGQLSLFSHPGRGLLFLQNGMGHLKMIEKLHGDIYVGTVEHGALKINSNNVLHTGIGVTKLAPFRRSMAKMQNLLNHIQKEEFPFLIEADYEKMLLKKLVVNAVINPLTAILQVKNGELIQNPHYFQMVKQIFAEIENSLCFQNKEGYFQNVIAVCEKTAHNQSSMLRDLMENRPTEIDAILGFILEKAAERKINTPIIQSFYQAVKGKEYRAGE
ncbi:2-dehydropantoate 2-reductase [Niallia endozanthoxylica]|uniref:2-dehydropantoate 2-reductase n=1 Tax=Niallia endozanthoxylica TaxID=2036016 RepID=A0A5J5HUC1_9BACI|nr:2-dehydropantoate 2-reductase [Niallia endozanthoxylica]KAA9025975.1 2-dehydropantoate 2-reductase [Niallia endozanthoxylica]